MKVTVTFDKEFSVPFWNASEARKIIHNIADRYMYKSNWYQIIITEENFIAFVSFSVSITGKDAKAVKEVALEIERRLTGDEEESPLQ